MNKPVYTIEVRNKMLERWRTLEDDFPENIRWLNDFLKKCPTNTRITNGKVKKLKGDLKDVYQYDVNKKDRVWYTVDNDNRIVRVIFAKGHP